jgi:hypothetical protein
MIPPGVIFELADAAVRRIKSPFGKLKGTIDASEADWDARCAQDYSAEIFVRSRALATPRKSGQTAWSEHDGSIVY